MSVDKNKRYGDPLVVVVSRQDVERGDIGPTLGVLARLLESVEVVRANEDAVEIAFHGYDDHPWELHDIEAVRTFVHKLDEKFPYWLYFLTKEGTGLTAIAWCFVPPFLTEEGRRTVGTERIKDLLERRWTPMLGIVCKQLGLTERETEQRFANAAHYFIEPIPALRLIQAQALLALGHVGSGNQAFEPRWPM